MTRVLCLQLLLMPAVYACTVTDVGNPNLDPVDLELDFSTVDSPDPFGTLELFGRPGSVDPDLGPLILFNLDHPVTPSRVIPGQDGSFEIQIEAHRGDHLRIRQQTEVARGLDFAAEDRPRPELLAFASAHCLRILPEYVLGIVDTEPASLTIENGCDHEVTFAPPHLATPGPVGFTIGEAPGSLGAGQSGSISIESGDQSVDEDVLVLPVVGPEEGNVALTLFRGGG